MSTNSTGQSQHPGAGKVDYQMGHDKTVTESHASRTVHSDAAFILPYIKPGMKILDVGCGPGTITSGFLDYVPEGSVIGVDYAEAVVQQALDLAQKTHVEDLKSEKLKFLQGDIYAGLPFDDDIFDLIFSSQVLSHLRQPVEALKEMRRVCKPGGMVAERTGDSFHWWPEIPGIELFQKGLEAMTQGHVQGRQVHAWARQAGFEPSKMTVGTGTSCIADEAGRRWWGDLHARRLEHTEQRAGWLKGGMTEEEIDRVVKALREWSENEDGWYCLLQSECIFRK